MGNGKKHHKQISDIDWYLDVYGPYTSDINDEIKNNENIVIIKQDSNLGTTRFTLQVKNNTENLNYKNLTSEEIEIINKTIEDTKTKSLFDFMAYVNSTKPIADGIRYNYLDLNSFIE